MHKFAKLAFGFLAVAVVGCFGTGVWAGEYTDKSYHDSGEIHTYKHPQQRSYTGPFDYGAKQEPRKAPAPKPTGKCNCFNFNATKSYDVDGQKLSVMWDFGDGQTSDQAVVQHCYEKAGDYTVTLTVKDSSGMVCDTGVNSVQVSSNFPPTAVLSDVKGCVGEAITFDGTSSTGSGALKYMWDFGDGQTGEGARTSHAYEKPGSYRVTLTVDDGKNTECSMASARATAQIASSVTVSLSGPESTCVGRTVRFDAQGTGSAKYSWDFGDGSTWEGGSSASHTYEKAGNYTVTVRADNGEGFSCSVAGDSTRIMVNAPPIADAGDNLACCVGQSTVFDASRSSSPGGRPLTYHWDFGDGATSDEMKASHAYEKSGTYRVMLTVKDDSGSDCGTASDSFVATVNTKPEAVIEVR